MNERMTIEAANAIIALCGDYSPVVFRDLVRFGDDHWWFFWDGNRIKVYQNGEVR